MRSHHATFVFTLAAAATLTACGVGGDSSRSSLPTGPAREEASIQSRLATLYSHLHDQQSGTEAHALLPDLTLVYTDDGHGNARIPSQILPFRYWYSAEGNVTVSICAQDYTVFICPGRESALVDAKDWTGCAVADNYRELETPPVGAP